ncbi:MAG: GntR family transcriptional regulator [Terriglobia bacterium]|jgi:DNA-binding GntR family transcriptional regulator
MAKNSARRQRANNSSIREMVALHIHRQISSGKLAAGDAISELSVAKELGVSRTPVREALGQLATEGILEQSPHRRAVVAKLTRQDIIDLYELREALEMYAAGKAARRPPHSVDLDKLRSLNDGMMILRDELEASDKSELDPDQMLRFVACDLGFHSQMMRLAANARMLKIVNETRVLLRIFAIRRHGHTSSLLADIHRRHSEVVRCIAEQNPEGAMQAISEHIQLSLRERLDDFDHREIEVSLGQAIPRFSPDKPLLLVKGAGAGRRT